MRMGWLTWVACFFEGVVFSGVGGVAGVVAEVGSGEADFEQGAGGGGGCHGLRWRGLAANVTFEQVFDGVPGVDAKVVGLAQDAGHGGGSVQIAQAKDLAHVVEVVGLMGAQILEPEGGNRIEGLEGEGFGGVLAAPVFFDEGELVVGIDDLLVPVVTAEMGGDEFALIVEVDPVVVAVEGDLLAGTGGRDAVTVAFAVNAAAVGDPDGEGLPGVAGVGVEWEHGGSVGGQDVQGAGVKFPVSAHVGGVFEPEAQLGVEAFQWRVAGELIEVAPVEEVAFDVADGAFDTAFFRFIRKVSAKWEKAAMGEG